MLCTKYRPCDRDHTLTVDELPHSGSLEGAQGSISFGDCYVAMDDGTGFGNRNSQIGSSAVKPMDSPSGSNTQLWLTGRQPWQTLSEPQRALNGQCSTFHMPVPTPCSCVSRFAQYCSRNDFVEPEPGRLRRGARRTPRHAVAFPQMPIVCNRLSAPLILPLFRWGFHHLCFIKIASRGHEQAQSQATTVNQSVPLSIRGRATFTCNSLHEFDYPFSAQGRRKREASTVHHRARPERLHIIRRVRLAPLPSYFSRHSTFPPALYSLFWEACVLT